MEWKIDKKVDERAFLPLACFAIESLRCPGKPLMSSWKRPNSSEKHHYHSSIHVLSELINFFYTTALAVPFISADGFWHHVLSRVSAHPNYPFPSYYLCSSDDDSMTRSTPYMYFTKTFIFRARLPRTAITPAAEVQDSINEVILASGKSV